MIASHPWLGITKPEWLIKSDTPQRRPPPALCCASSTTQPPASSTL
jgi:hypothetical protein